MCLLTSSVYADRPDATLEFRLAVTDAADGYSKHAVAESDDVVYVAGKAVVTGRDIKEISFSSDASGNPMVGFVLTDDGSEKFFAATSENIGKKLAILLDGAVVSAPNILSGIKKEGRITGNFDDDDLLRFFTAIVLRQPASGAKLDNDG